jgi:hypothetical protein
MNAKLSIFLVLIFSFCFLIISSNTFAQSDGIKLYLGGNAFFMHSKGVDITEKGIANWTDTSEVITAYVRVNKIGYLYVYTDELNKFKGNAEIEISINNIAKKVSFNENEGAEKYIGSWMIYTRDTGYVPIKIRGISKTEATFPALTSLILKGDNIDKETVYVKNNEGNYFYWGRRGPSVHLNYEMPDKVDAEWFLTEIYVPPGEDVTGTFFMTNGFAEGYFGIQKNSTTERRILFSIWSPYKTDNPKDIPENERITLIKKGKDVHVGEFGNEGAGGQSYLLYNWKAGVSYQLLMHAEPTAENCTIYTAYFYDPQLKKWLLIASFKRPQTHTYLKRIHSFLENFDPIRGDLSRMAIYSNQWVRDPNGLWYRIESAKFSVDNTAKINYRKDYAGGSYYSGDNKNGFYLKNCGFFKNFTPPGKILTNTPITYRTAYEPVNLKKLPLN